MCYSLGLNLTYNINYSTFESNVSSNSSLIAIYAKRKRAFYPHFNIAFGLCALYSIFITNEFNVQYSALNALSAHCSYFISFSFSFFCLNFVIISLSFTA